MRRLLVGALGVGLLGVVFACSDFGSTNPASPTTPTAEAGPVPDATAAPTGFCSTVDATFCWSFDDAVRPFGAQLRASTTGINESHLTDTFVSPPTAMFFAVRDGGSGGSVSSVAAAELPLTAALQNLRCSGSIKIERMPASDFAYVFELVSEIPHLMVELQPDLAVGGVRAHLHRGYPSVAPKFVANIPLNTWTKVRWGTTNAPPDRKIELEVEGAPAVTDTMVNPLLSGNTYARFGIETFDGKNEWAIDYDNIECSYD